MENYKVLVFDWDGTLFDSMQYKHKNTFLALQEFNWANEEEIFKIHSETTGLPRKILFNSIAISLRGEPFTDKEYSKVSNLYTSLNIASAKQAKVFPEVIEFLLKITKKIPVYVSSSADVNEVNFAADFHNVKSYFIELLGSTPGFSKGKEHLNYIGSKEKVNSKQLIFVGDDIHDVKLGNEANVFTLRIMRKISNKKENYPVLNQLKELEKYFV